MTNFLHYRSPVTGHEHYVTFRTFQASKACHRVYEQWRAGAIDARDAAVLLNMIAERAPRCEKPERLSRLLSAWLVARAAQVVRWLCCCEV